MEFSSHTLIYVVATSLLVIVFLSKQAYDAFTGPLASLPGPKYTLFTAWPDAIHGLRHTRVQWITALHAKYGPVVRISPIEVSISDIDTSKKIYALGSQFLKSAFYDNFNLKRRSRNIFDERSFHEHARKRRLLGGPMSEGSLLDTYQRPIRQKTEKCVERISAEMNKYGHADVLKWNLFMATDLIGELAFGSSFEMLETGKKSQYSRDLEAVGSIGGRTLYIPKSISVLGKLRVPGFRLSLDLLVRLNSYAVESITRHSRQVTADPDNVPPTLLSKLYARRDAKGGNGEETMSVGELVMEARAYLIAGTDTTGNSLSYLLWQLARHPQIQARLSAEVNALPADFDAATLKNAKFLNQVIDEALRLHSAAPALLPRTVPAGGLQACGYFIPPGCTVGTQAFTLHRDFAVFPDPERFNPDRWEQPTQAMKDAHRPFGAGSRICIGKHLATMELRLVTTLLYRRYPQGLEVAYGATLPSEDAGSNKGFRDEDMDMSIHFLLSPKGHRCLLRPRAA